MLLIAFGESILALGATFAALHWSARVVAALVVGFVATVSLWWTYFVGHADDAARTISRAADPTHVARAGYAYAHAIMVGGIIVLAVAIDLTIAHPTAAAGTAAAAVTLGGPALYLVGDGLFKYAISGRTPWPRIGGALALALLAPLALVAGRLELSAAAALVVVALAVAQIWTRPDRVQAA